MSLQDFKIFSGFPLACCCRCSESSHVPLSTRDCSRDAIDEANAPSSLVEPRTVVRVRVRRCVVRVRISETAVNVRVVVRTTDNTAVGLFRDAKVGIFGKHQTLQAEKFSFACSFLHFGQRKREQPCGSPSDAFSKFSLCALFVHFDYVASEGEPRTVARVRVRRCVDRARTSETAVNVRAVVRTTDNTAGTAYKVCTCAIVSNELAIVGRVELDGRRVAKPTML